MKGDKYCYEIIQHIELPLGFNFHHIVTAQTIIEKYLTDEKLLRRQGKKKSQEELRSTLDKKFETNVRRIVNRDKEAIGITMKSQQKEHAKVMNQIRERCGQQEGYSINLEFVEKIKRSQRDHLYRYGKAQMTHKQYDPVIERFEKEYQEKRPDLVKIKNDLKILLHPYNPCICSSDSTMELSIVNSEYDSVTVAVIFKGDARFQLKNKANYVHREIYEHRQNNLEYVKDANGFFVKRYVYRCMADYDNAPVKGFTSRNGMIPMNSVINNVILKHLRAAQQGESYFISFTTTKKRIFGSTGKEFYNPKNGAAIIDLSMVPQEQVFDVHGIKAINNIITTKDLSFDMQFIENDDSYERNAAARDTVRTRELLVAKEVPKAAVVSIKKNGFYSGDWCDLDGSTTKTNLLEKRIFPD